VFDKLRIYEFAELWKNYFKEIYSLKSHWTKSLNYWPV